MTSQSIMLLVAFLIVLMVLAYPLGLFMAKVGDGTPIRGFGWLAKIENVLYRLSGTRAQAAMNWKGYAVALLVFNTLGALFVYAIQRVQLWLPLNPQAMVNVSPDSSFNTAVSFAANTNWQGYVGEATMSYLTQMLALTGQNFFSAATGIAVAFALIRGFSSRSAKSIGNFWVDMTRSTLYVLLPLSVIVAVVLMGQGVIQNFSAYKDVSLLDPVTYSQPKNDAAGQPMLDAQGKPVMETLTTKTQTIAMGPVASQEAIKMLGTNGGGFFNANSAHPYENPTAFANFIQMLAIFPDSGRLVLHVRSSGQRYAARLGGAWGDDIDFCRDDLRRDDFGTASASGTAGIGRRSVDEHVAIRRQHGRQGNAFRYQCLCIVCSRNDGGFMRCSQRHA
jgi:K+-transporting ATPase ATPase A chain